MRGPGTHTGERVHADEGVLVQLRVLREGKVQVRAPRAPTHTGEEGLAQGQ